MYAHHAAAPAPPHSLPHMGINDPHPPQPPHAYTNNNNGYAHNVEGGQYAAPATVAGYGYAPPPQMHSYTVNSHPHYPPPPPALPRAPAYPAGPSSAFNDFGMPTSPDVHGAPAPPVHPSTVGGFPVRTPGYNSYQGYQGFQGFPPQPPPPQPAPLKGVEAIPPPVPRAAYQGPQFKTFAERKREREEELRRQAAEAAAKQAPPPPLTPAGRAQPAPPASSAQVANGAPAPPARSDSVFAPGARTPSPAAMRMMGAQSPNDQPNGRPLPPPRSTSGPAPPSPGGRALPTPRGASGPSPSPSPQPWAQQGVPTPPVPPIPQQYGRPVSPVPPPRSVSPAPPPRSVSPAPPPRSSTTPVPPSPAPPPRSGTSPVPSSPSRPPVSPVRSIVNLPPSVPRNAAVQALLERSDTISSVRSLDRGAFGPNRSLPQPPIGVKSSMSLDRGSSPSGRMMPLPRRGPSPVPEESQAEIVGRMAGVHIGSVPPRSESASPTKRDNPLPRSQSPHPSVTPKRSSAPVGSITSVGPPPQAPVINVAPPRAPSPQPPVTKPAPPPLVIEPPAPPMIMVRSDSPPTPKITVGTPPTPTISVSPPAICVEPERPPSPGFSYSGLPTIDVSSSDTCDEPPAISISVPNGGPASARPSTPTRSSRVNPRSPRSPRSPRGVGATRIEPDSAIICAGCEQPIIGRIVSAMKQRWHPQCFTCGVCGDLLEHVSSYEHDGKPYCHLDYHDRFAHKCHHCHTPIVDPRFITLNDEVLGERYYHELHFFCSECGDPFLDPSKSSAAGTEFGGGTEEDGETNAFVIHKGHPYCERCHLRLHKPKCRACKNPIPDVAVSAMGAKYHKECFVCSNCSCGFANNLFFPRDGKAFCTECFERMTDM